MERIKLRYVITGIGLLTICLTTYYGALHILWGILIFVLIILLFAFAGGDTDIDTDE